MNDFNPSHISTKAYKRVGQKVVIFNEKNQILILKRSQKTGNGGKWSLAGGAIEDREEPSESIQREIKEETQLTVTKLKPFFVFSYIDKNGDSIVIIAYTCLVKNPQVIINWEHDDYKWVTKEEALQMDLSEHATKIIKQLS